VRVSAELGYRTIAEYVEGEGTLDLLRSYGVDLAQGFHLGRPVPLAQAFG
jgi:EAL domain-containing protein (putative c-di-GMP-specific phosphodiesterase class I)